MSKFGHLFEVRRGMREEEEATLSQPQESQPPDDRPPKPLNIGHESRPPQSQPQESRPQPSRPRDDRPPHNLLAALPDVKGHLEYPYQVLDHLFRHLDPFEQAVYTQLYRLSWGHKSNRCLISNERLAERSGVSLSKVKLTTAALELKGLVRKLDRPHGLKVVQGVEYEVAAPAWQLHRSRPPQSQPSESRPPDAPNKDKELKETNKGAGDCPDCFGTGWHYPEGTAKGVRRCGHERLSVK